MSGSVLICSRGRSSSLASLLVVQLLLAVAFPTIAGHTQAEDESDTQREGVNQHRHMAEAVHFRSVLFALGFLSAIFLAVLLGLRIYLRCVHRRPQRQSRRKKVIEEEIDQRFPVTTVHDEPTCVVCLSTIEAEDKCRITQCGHSFHADCLLAWWVHKPKRVLRCPICRTRQRMRDSKRSKVRQLDGGDAASDVAAQASGQEEHRVEVADDAAGAAPEEQAAESRPTESNVGQSQDSEESRRADDSAGSLVVDSLAVGIPVADSLEGEQPVIAVVPSENTSDLVVAARSSRSERMEWV